MEICKYCHHEFKKIKYHEIYCKENPDRIIKSSWNKGLTKETSESVRKYTETTHKKMKEGLIKPSNLGRKHTEEEKKKISESIKKFMNENPNKIGFIAHHSSNKSYPEKYFEEIFKNRNIPLLYHKQISRFELDFYNDKTKRYIEIDGKQHYENEKNIQRDLNRMMELEIRGWIGKRIKWEEYKRMSIYEQDNLIEDIRKFVLGDNNYCLSTKEKEYREQWLKDKEEKYKNKLEKNNIKIQKRENKRIERENKRIERENKKKKRKELYKDIKNLIQKIDLNKWNKNKQLKNLLYPKYGKLTTKQIEIAIKTFDIELYYKFQNKNNRLNSKGTIGQQWIHNPLTKETIRIKKEDIDDYLKNGWKLGRK